MGFREDKQARKDYYMKYVYKRKLKRCTACNGSGYYDSTDKNGNIPKCGACNGTGKERDEP